MSNRFYRFALATALTAVTSISFAAKICIDPGHGGSDPGAVGSGQQEKTNNLNTCLKFRTWLNSDNSDGAGGGSWTNVMTRTTDVFVSLQGRCDISNNASANRFMCLHNNACCGASGTETFSAPSPSSTTADLRNKVQQRSVEAWGLTNRGNKTYNFYVLLNTVANAELAELGFIDNPLDSTFCGSSTQQDKMARYHLYALQNHYGITAYTPGSGSAATYTDDSPSASANWVTATSSADKFGADYKWRATEAISDPASWSATVAAGGNYDISAWWSEGSNRSTTAGYHLPNGTVVTRNQQSGGGAWNLLGTISLSAGAQETQLSCWTTTGFVVVADAVKYFGPK